jgi:hypothetical protein
MTVLFGGWLCNYFLGAMLIVFMDMDCMHGVVPAPPSSRNGQEDSAPGEGSEQKVQHRSGLFSLGFHDLTGLKREFGPAGGMSGPRLLDPFIRRNADPIDMAHF